jgi:hypothetical protein
MAFFPTAIVEAGLDAVHLHQGHKVQMFLRMDIVLPYIVVRIIAAKCVGSDS